MPKGVNEKIWKEAKDAFYSAYKHKPENVKDYKIIMSIYKKIKNKKNNKLYKIFRVIDKKEYDKIKHKKILDINKYVTTNPRVIKNHSNANLKGKKYVIVFYASKKYLKPYNMARAYKTAKKFKIRYILDYDEFVKKY